MRPVRAAGPGLGPVRAGILPAKSRPLLFATPERTRGFAVIYFAFSYPQFTRNCTVRMSKICLFLCCFHSMHATCRSAMLYPA